MILLLRIINSVVFLLLNLSLGVYILQKFFRTLKMHYQLMEEVEEFTHLVNQSRTSLDYVGSKVNEAMKEIEEDVAKEVSITHHLTALTIQVSSLVGRFKELEQAVIEYARIDRNMENATVETPSDINEEVRRIVSGLKQNKKLPVDEKPSLASHKLIPQKKAGKLSKNHNNPSGVEAKQNSVATISLSQKSTPASSFRDCGARDSPRPKTPTVVPVVQLLSEPKKSEKQRPIGFRPSWMVETSS